MPSIDQINRKIKEIRLKLHVALFNYHQNSENNYTLFLLSLLLLYQRWKDPCSILIALTDMHLPGGKKRSVKLLTLCSTGSVPSSYLMDLKLSLNIHKSQVNENIIMSYLNIKPVQLLLLLLLLPLRVIITCTYYYYYYYYLLYL